MNPLASAEYYLRDMGFEPECEVRFGTVWSQEETNTAIILDQGICDTRYFPYFEYTSEQNHFVRKFSRVFRFVVDAPEDVKGLQKDLPIFLSGDWDTCTGRRRGSLRSESAIDPTGPESRFESAFAETFGEMSLYALEREYAFIDLDDVYRPVDYVLHTERGLIAIELNGEAFHHPVCIKKEGYQRQLRKQNSLSAAGFRVFRWTDSELDGSPQLKSDLERSFGSKETFRSKARYQTSRQLAQIVLHPHQDDALARLSLARREGKSASLLVLPTALGKTEIALADFLAFKEECPNATGLFVVPTSELRNQTLRRAAERIPGLTHSCSPLPKEKTSGLTVQTYQFLNRHYDRLSPEEFDYIVLDEAHHVMAPGINRFVRHFAPEFLLGMTATPERLDQRRLEEVFGSYETTLTLQSAIEHGLLPPIRAFRVNTGVDLSEVRFRGVDYVAADLQEKVIVPSRDKLIVDLLLRYFRTPATSKQGIVFCVNVRHAESLATRLCGAGISAAAISSKNKDEAETTIQKYRAGKVQFICSCMLVNEGFDVPQTSVVVMARPTLSKVLYTQQLGRGTRKCEGKEALYVIDMVDNYAPGRLNSPWSVHALLEKNSYLPWGNVLSPKLTAAQGEEEILVELLESERRIEEIDIFTFESKYGNFLSEEQMARELFKDTSTLRSWIKKGDIVPRVSVPFGARQIHFFAPEQAAEIRSLKNLKAHDETTAYEDFLEFLEQRDYSMSYKMTFLLSMLSELDELGSCTLHDLASRFQRFYATRLAKGLPADRKSCPFNSSEALDDRQKVIECILSNPFEKFERKRFLFHCKDLSRLGFATAIWSGVSKDAQIMSKIQAQLIEDLVDYYKSLGGGVDPKEIAGMFPLSNLNSRAVSLERPDQTKLIFVTPNEETAWKICLPIFEHYAAAGNFSESQDAGESQWVDFASLGLKRSLTKNMFLLRVQGHSMEPEIPSGAICLFVCAPGGTRQGRIVLAELGSATEPETGGRYTVKRYRSVKKHNADLDIPENFLVELHPLNPNFATITLTAAEAEQVRIRGEFLEVVTV